MVDGRTNIPIWHLAPSPQEQALNTEVHIFDIKYAKQFLPEGSDSALIIGSLNSSKRTSLLQVVPANDVDIFCQYIRSASHIMIFGNN